MIVLAYRCLNTLTAFLFANMFLFIAFANTYKHLHTPKNLDWASMMSLNDNRSVEDWRALEDITQDYTPEIPKNQNKQNVREMQEADFNENYNPDHTKRDTIVRNEVFDWMLSKNDFSPVEHEIKNMIRKDHEDYKNTLAEIGILPNIDYLNEMQAALNDKDVGPEQKEEIAHNLEVQKQKNFLLNRFEGDSYDDVD